jgi:hypothetical protein
MTLATRSYDGRMKHRTPAYWPTRIMLAVGSIGTVIAFALALMLMLAEPPVFGPEPTILGLPTRVAEAALAVGLAVLGLVWMIRIFRGPRDEPPPWRYRDR